MTKDNSTPSLADMPGARTAPADEPAVESRVKKAAPPTVTHTARKGPGHTDRASSPYETRIIKPEA